MRRYCILRSMVRATSERAMDHLHHDRLVNYPEIKIISSSKKSSPVDNVTFMPIAWNTGKGFLW